MLSWLSANIGTIIVLAIVIAVIVSVIISMHRNKKKGCSSCGCGCKDCAQHDQCGCTNTNK